MNEKGGNFFGSVVNLGRHDAGYGLLLKGDGNGNFLPVDLLHSGLIIKGEVRDMKSLQTVNWGEIIVIARNNLPVQVVRNNPPGQVRLNTPQP